MSSRRPHSQTPTSLPETPLKSNDVYREFARWTSKRAPKWHEVKKTRYVFWRMMQGRTINDAIREIHWEARFFWHLVDEHFTNDYTSAKLIQSRAFADSMVSIAEGRDATTRRAMKKTTRLIARAMKQMAKSSSKTSRRMLLSQLLGDLREHDKIVMTRNKMQIDTMKWMASKANPAEFGEKSTIGLGVGGFSGDDGTPTRSISIVFVAPDGKDVPFNPPTGVVS